ncbi:SPASM domain-containing protein [Candidatus Woesearchaeota archaeon]|nr:SPASM domain-containing protein [Candidatus Woesearchaeota archaeon]
MEKDLGLFLNNLKYIRNKIFGYPSDVMIEPTNACNLSCVLCPCSHKFMKRKSGFMQLKDYKRIIDKISGMFPKVTLFFAGESFLHPDIIKMIEVTAKKNIEVTISTNATKMDDIDGLLKSGLSRLIISLDGLSEKTYKKYRVGSDYTKVIGNIKKLCKRKKELGLKKPKIEIQFICMKHNQHEVKKLEKFMENVGPDKIFIKTVAIPSWFYKGKDFDRLADEFLPTNKYRRYSKKGKKWKLIKATGKCGFTRKTVITWEGEVCLCCYDLNAEYSFGNILEKSFLEIWNSPKYKKTRELVKTRSLKLCKECGASMVMGKPLE